MKKDKLCLVETGGSSIVRYKSIFSNDSKYLLCPCGNVIKVYSTTTGQCWQKLLGHTDNVTKVDYHPSIKLQVISSSLDNTIRLWDYEDGVMLSSIHFNAPLLGVFSCKLFPKIAFLVRKTAEGNELCRFHLDFSGSSNTSNNSDIIMKSMDRLTEKEIAFSKNFFVVSRKKSLQVFSNLNTVKRKDGLRHYLKAEDSLITCVACHPDLEQCVTGHKNGEIRFWFNITNLDRVTFNIQHWHSLQVLSLSYTSSGSSILSGGHEGVLVQWTKDGRHFLPRLGAPLQQLTVADDNTLYAASHSDNSISIITNYMTIRITVEGFTAIGDAPCGLNYDPTTRSCVTNGKPGHLLFYFPQTDEQLYNLDIVSRNFISPVDLEKSLPQTKITKVDFVITKAGEHLMATVEFDKENLTDQKLKIWSYDVQNQQWCLSAIISCPHDNRHVTSLYFHPTEAACITTAEDGFAKLWKLDTDIGWCCESTMTYRGYPSFDSSYSQDGSVLALAYGHTVSLSDPWLLDDLVILASETSNIRRVEFGRDSNCHLLVVATDTTLQSWSVITSSLIWLIDIRGFELLVKDPFSDYMVLFDTSSTVHVFRPSEKLPMFSKKLEVKVVGATIVPGSPELIGWSQKSQLYMISNKMTVHKLCPKDEADIVPTRVLPVATATLKTPMASLLAGKKEAVDDITMHSVSLRNRTLQEAVDGILNTPSHVLPPIHSFHRQFIAALLLDGEPMQQNPGAGVTEMEVTEEASSKVSTKPVVTGSNQLVPVDDFAWLAESFAKLN